MGDGFTVTLMGKGGIFNTLLNEELDFATQPYEVCLQEMIFSPGSWGNVRPKVNWFIVYNRTIQTSKTLFLPPKQYQSITNILYELNRVIADE